LNLFLVSFFLVYGLVHLYGFYKIKSALSLSYTAGLPIVLLMVLMVLSPVIVYHAERAGFELFARIMSFTGYLWMGFLFLFFSLSLAIDIYNLLTHLAVIIANAKISAFIPSEKTSFFICIFFAVTAGSYGYFEAKNVRIEQIVIKTSKIPEETGRLKIVQISDVHLGLIVRQKRLKSIVDGVKKTNPDILVSTGDLVDGQINKLEGLAELLLEIKPRYGKYAVTGNHEYYAGLSQALKFTKKAGFTILRGKAVAVRELLNLAGVDDSTGKSFNLFTDVPEKGLLSGLDHNRFTILLKHRPEVDEFSNGLFDLQLSGHTHKGQIFPFSLLIKLLFIQDAGYMKFESGSSLYVNRGSGTWGPPIRFLSPPEVTVIELVHEG
jgi:predicted MPP superfamily phosphohydrolase